MDICVYGGTSGGVIAAVKAARLGKHVALICDKNHLGGMTSSGLGWTDVGHVGTAYIQGMANEFYTRVNAKYGRNVNYEFEPHVAEAVFNDMVAEAGVMVFTNQYLVSVTKQGTQIRALQTSAGNIFEAREYIDASYTGDLMAAAGVSYTIGRESINQYGESLAGVRPPDTSFGSSVNPYVISNVPSSGLLPLIQSNLLAPSGSADQLVQTYNFRMCFSSVSSNRMAFTAPTNYNAALYQLVARYIQANSVTLSGLMTFSTPLPNSKMDINNGGAVSTDFVGESSAYSEANPALRNQIYQDHKNYEQGFFYFLANDPSVPASVRSSLASWGPAKDEFTDNGGWPWELYVRESRRMVSDYVMTQSNVFNLLPVPDAIGMAGYFTDSHYCERILVNGSVVNEGSARGDITVPYPVAYRALVSKTNECSNLLVPWSLSASHIAFCSIRMEPAFMILSQAAGTAASIAMDDGVTVQKVNVTKLQNQLVMDAQNLGTSIMSNSTSAIIVDNADATGVTITGFWTNSSASTGFYGPDYLHDGDANKGIDSVTFRPNLPQAGQYQVYARWAVNANRSANTPIDVGYPNGTNTFLVNQTQQGGQWNLLLTTNFNAGTNGYVRVRNTGTTGYVIADAVEFVDSLPMVNLWAADGRASRYGPQTAMITINRTGNTNNTMNISLNITGTAVNGTDYSVLPTSITLPPGVAATNINIVPLTNSAPVGVKTVTISLVPNASYMAGALTNANIVIDDIPMNAWKLQYFGTNAGNLSVAGEAANPSGDGVPNIIKYALGLNPLQVITNPICTFGEDTNGYFALTYTRPDPPPADISYQVVSSDDLTMWCTNGECTKAGAILLNQNGTATVTAETTTPVSSKMKQFLSLRMFRK
ncbi:MAG TPA: FAD-dependent oxidoreductase [Verrucomicrobiae bacterium]